MDNRHCRLFPGIIKEFQRMFGTSEVNDPIRDNVQHIMSTDDLIAILEGKRDTYTGRQKDERDEKQPKSKGGSDTTHKRKWTHDVGRHRGPKLNKKQLRPTTLYNHHYYFGNLYPSELIDQIVINANLYEPRGQFLHITKKNRSKPVNFSKEEDDKLRVLIDSRASFILGKSTEALQIQQKDEAWIHIAKRFNETPIVEYRTMKQIRRRFRVIKRTAGKEAVLRRIKRWLDTGLFHSLDTTHWFDCTVNVQPESTSAADSQFCDADTQIISLCEYPIRPALRPQIAKNEKIHPKR